MRITHLSPASYTSSPWKNGGGITVDMCEERMPGSLPGSWQGILWRLGRTTISTPAPFSDLSGFDRCQVVIAGSGLVLDTPDGEVDLRLALKPVRYRGEAPISSRLENGPVGVVNLIAARQHAIITLEVLQAGARRDLAGGICVFYAATGLAVLQLGGGRYPVEADHALRLDGADTDVMCEQGTILLASITLL